MLKYVKNDKRREKQGEVFTITSTMQISNIIKSNQVKKRQNFSFAYWTGKKAINELWIKKWPRETGDFCLKLICSIFFIFSYSVFISTFSNLAFLALSTCEHIFLSNCNMAQSQIVSHKTDDLNKIKKNLN